MKETIIITGLLLSIAFSLGHKGNTTSIPNTKDINFAPEFISYVSKETNLTVTNWEYALNESALVSLNNKSITFYCTAPFPITWIISGYLVSHILVLLYVFTQIIKIRERFEKVFDVS